MKKSYDMRLYSKSNEKHLLQAINIYSQNIELNLRTDTREILYWIDNFNKDQKDKFFVCGFYENDRVIGFAQFAYFFSEKIICFDYLVIDKNHRQNNTYFQFINQLQEFLAEQEIVYDFIIAEVGGFLESKEPTIITRSIIRLLKMSGFKVIKSNYYHPKLSRMNFESELQSVLMLFTNSELQSIKKETYLLIVDTMYFKHYRRWYEPFLSESENRDYQNDLLNLKHKIVEELKDKKSIALNGYYVPTTNNPKSIIRRKAYSIPLMLGYLTLFLFFLILFGSIHIFVKNKLNIDTSAQSYIVIASVIGVMFIISIIIEGKTKPISHLIQKLINKFTG